MLTVQLRLQVIANAFDFCKVANPDGWCDVDSLGVGGCRGAAGDLDKGRTVTVARWWNTFKCIHQGVFSCTCPYLTSLSSQR